MEIIKEPFFQAFLGWALWNAIIFRIDKDEYDDADKSFPFAKYISCHWDNWLVSFFGVPVILTGASLLDIVDAFHDNDLQWSDAFYLLSGFAIEAVIYFVKKWKKKQTV